MSAPEDVVRRALGPAPDAQAALTQLVEERDDALKEADHAHVSHAQDFPAYHEAIARAEAAEQERDAWKLRAEDAEPRVAAHALAVAKQRAKTERAWAEDYKAQRDEALKRIENLRKMLFALRDSRDLHYVHHNANIALLADSRAAKEEGEMGETV